MPLSEKAQKIIERRYLWHDKGETKWQDIAERVGTTIGGATHGEIYSDLINQMYFIPAGRILRNTGRTRGSLFNCYCLPIGDSREEIGELFKNALILWGEGGGVGINFSTLRPKGAEIKGVGGHSSGLVSFLRATDGIASTIESGGQRRAASLGLCEVFHPEIEAFIDSKLKDGDIRYFNLSVGITEDFIDAIRNDKQWSLHFNKQETKKISATDLWQKIIKNMLHNGEPGLINMDNLTRNNSYYFSPIVGTNPCGETCLEEYGVCNLGSLVLPKFVINGRVQWSKMEETIRHAVRFLDTCIDINKYTLDRIKQTALKGRRIGLGVMGLADMLFNLGLRYGSNDALDFVGQLFKRIRNYTYSATIGLASEKGSFPAFDSSLYTKAKFVASLPHRMRLDIRKYGTRNVTCLAIAPTGTISLVPETTSSIEPLFCKAYRRNDRVQNSIYIHPYCSRNNKNDKGERFFIDSQDVSPSEHIETQTIVQRYVDGAVSKTINLPRTYSNSELAELLLESISDLKGVTVYKEGSRKNQILTPLSNKEIKEALKDNSISTRTTADEATVKCASNTCEI